jgi:hypothetical protein
MAFFCRFVCVSARAWMAGFYLVAFNMIPLAVSGSTSIGFCWSFFAAHVTYSEKPSEAVAQAG